MLITINCEPFQINLEFSHVNFNQLRASSILILISLIIIVLSLVIISVICDAMDHTACNQPSLLPAGTHSEFSVVVIIG